MNRTHVILIMFFGFSLFSKAQTFSDIDMLSNFTGETFVELENDLKLKNVGRKSVLGLEHRHYDFKNFSALFSEIDDTKTIGEISLLPNSKGDYQELWYSIVSKMNNSENYKFIKSFVADPDKKKVYNSLNYDDLIALLRNNYKSNKWIYELTYQRDNVFYRISCSPVNVGVSIQNRPFEKKSYEDL